MTGFVGGWDKDKYLYYSIATGQVIVFDKEIWEDIENEDVNDEVTQAFRDFAFKSNYVDNGKQMKLVILPTEECNFRCSYCYESFKEGKMDEDIQDRIVRYVENNVQNYNSLYVPPRWSSAPSAYMWDGLVVSHWRHWMLSKAYRSGLLRYVRTKK